MKIQQKNQKERLEFFSGLLENATLAYSDVLAGFDKNMQQYKGSREIDGSREAATTVRNITYEIVESQVSSTIPYPKADPPAYSEKKGRLAQTIERLCRSVRERLPFTKMNDLCERYTYIFGGSIWFVEWDNEYKSGAVTGDVSIHCISPKCFIPEPYVYDLEEMEYCFLRLTTTRGAIMRKYGISDSDSERLEFDIDSVGGLSDTVIMNLCFYRDEDGEISMFTYSGEVTLSDIQGYYKRKIKRCTLCGHRDDICKCEKPKLILENQASEEITDPKEAGLPINVDYYLPRRFPFVIRKNTSSENCLLGQSDCDYIRPEQQAINKIESRILQKLLRAGITPVVPEDASVSINNSVFGQVIKMKPGESMAQYGKVDTTPDISQDILEAERLYEHSKRILGISDAYQGISFDGNESGYARQLRITQASGRLESKRKMKETAYAELDRLIFQHYLAFADDVRVLSFRDSFGRVQGVRFNRYDFLEYDIISKRYYYDDCYLFDTDRNGDEVFGREEIWQRNLENLKSGTLGDVSLSTTLLRYWQCQERAHYPGARENVEYFEEIVREEAKIYDPIPKGLSTLPADKL